MCFLSQTNFDITNFDIIYKLISDDTYVKYYRFLTTALIILLNVTMFPTQRGNFFYSFNF